MGERNLERFGIGIVIILILSLTPLTAWLMMTVGVDKQWWGKYAIRIVTGLLIYIAAMYAISGLSDQDTVEVEGDKGKLTVNRFMLVAGLIIIAVGWLTDISAYLVSSFHLTFWLELGGVVYKNTSVWERLIISVFTFVGAFLIKRSIGRKESTETDWPDASEIYEKTKKRK